MAKKQAAAGDGKKAKKKPKKREQTAAQAVRDYQKANPQATNQEVIAALAKQGIVIDDYLPSAIRGEAKRAARRKAAPKPSPPQPTGPPMVLVHTPVYDKFLHDLSTARTHSQMIKTIRILIAKLQRTIEIVDALKDDDWEIKILSNKGGLQFLAKHAMATNVGQARARVQKLGIKPNEVEIAT